MKLDPDLRSLQEVRECIARAKAAADSIREWKQAEVDRVCKAMADAAAKASFDLARLAVEETGIGRVHYKVLKNLFGSEGTWESIQNEKTVGVIARDERKGIVEVATPAGVVACIIPTTNPTSTAMFKALIAVKGRNSIVVSPHPRARRCISETVEVMRRAIERAGGPPDLLMCLQNPTIESTGALMKHKDTALILATGGSGLVRAAYSSGKPAYGVGPGNTPVYVDRSADVAWAAQSVTSSQSFDNATLCCSEQGIVLDEPIAERFVAEMQKRGAYLCDAKETDLLAKHCNVRGHMNPDVVGTDPWRIAEAAGFRVPRHTTVLLAWQGGVGDGFPLAIEILAPVLSLHLVKGWRHGCEVCKETLHLDGLGHTMGIHARDEELLEEFFLQKPANRIVVNGPCSQGAVGYSTNLVPSFSLGCGPQAGNITSDNISARHLINVKRVAFVRRDWEETCRKGHERAAAMGAEAAPRGSGMPGDPALSGSSPAPSSSASAAVPTSNWKGNPPMSGPGGTRSVVTPPSSGGAPPRPMASSAARPAASPSIQPKVQAAQKVRPQAAVSAPPTFTRPGTPPSVARPASPVAAPSAVLARPANASPSNAPLNSPYVGGALSSGEIQSMMSGAGSGCPLGPCKGCPHHDVQSGACRA